MGRRRDGGRPATGASSGSRSSALNIVDQAPAIQERADASRNRARILEAARRLLSEKPMAEICMDAVAAMAGVGKGTVYRRFPDRTALCLALLDEETKLLQTRVLDGFDLPADARTIDRLYTLLDAIFDFVFDHASLLSEAWAAQRRGTVRYDHPGHTWLRQALAAHLSRAVKSGELEPIDVLTTSELVLAGLNAELVRWLAEAVGDRERVKDSFRVFWRRALPIHVPLGES